MGITVTLELSRSDGKRVVIDGRIWSDICHLARLNGFAVSDEAMLSQVDATYLRDALQQGLARMRETESPGRAKRGSAMFTAPDVGFLSDTVGQTKLRQVIDLLSRGAVAITRRKRV